MPSAADFNNMFADASTAYVATSEGTTSTTYGDLTTSGPAVTLSLVNGQQVLVLISAKMSNTVGGGSAAKMSFAVSGAGTQAASDADSGESAQTNAQTTTRVATYAAGATGSFTFTCKYRSVSSGTSNFAERRVIVKKY